MHEGLYSDTPSKIVPVIFIFRVNLIFFLLIGKANPYPPPPKNIYNFNMLKEYTIPKKGPSSWTQLPLKIQIYLLYWHVLLQRVWFVRQKTWLKVFSVLWTSSDPYPNTFSCTHICTCKLKTALYVLILCLNPLKEVITEHFSITKLTYISEPKKVFKQIKGLCIPPSISIGSENSLSSTNMHNSHCQDMPLSPMNFLLKIGVHMSSRHHCHSIHALKRLIKSDHSAYFQRINLSMQMRD